MADFGPDDREFIQTHIDDHGFLSWLGVQVDSVDPGRVVMRVPYSDDLTNPRLAGIENGRTVHGGVAEVTVESAVDADERAAVAAGRGSYRVEPRVRSSTRSDPSDGIRPSRPTRRYGAVLAPP